MLEELFGNETAARVLLFMGINQEGYASEIARTLALPQSVVHKHLQRLEEAGLLVSIPRGTLRVFHWNPRYPLLKEVKALVDRAIEFLPEDERARYAIRLRPRRMGKPG